MTTQALKTELRSAYLAGGVEAAAELARARGLEAAAELSDRELELVAGGKDSNFIGNRIGGGNAVSARK